MMIRLNTARQNTSWGNNLKKIVKVAAGGKNGILIDSGKAKGTNMLNIIYKTYSNGVQIRYGSLKQTEPHCYEIMDVLGIFRPHADFDCKKNKNLLGQLYATNNPEELESNPHLLDIVEFE